MNKRYVRTECYVFDRLTVMITDTETGNVFPESDENQHYVLYKAWLEAGNEPELISTTPACDIYME